VVKTGTSGTSAMVVAVRIGTAGTTADTAMATLTFDIQSAVADEGAVDVNVVFRSVGSGTSAVIQAVGMLDHRLANTGLTTVNTSIKKATSAGFNSTTAGLKIGCSVIGGNGTTSSVSLVQAELFNLA